MTRRKIEPWLPWIILILALGVRLWGINFSLPFIYHVDEERFAQISLNYLRGDLNPHFFHVPSLYTYAVAGLWKLYYLIGHALGSAGQFASFPEFLNHFSRNPTGYILLGRLLTVLLSVGTILAVYHLGKYLAGPWVGALGALALIFSPEHNKISHYLVPDAPMVFFLVLSYFQVFKIYERGKMRHFIWSGLFAGLAFTTKYGGHFLVLPLILAQAFRTQEKKESWWKVFLNPGLFLWGLTFLVVFSLGTPYAWLDRATFWRDFRWQSAHLFSLGHFGSSTAQPAWLFYLQYGLAENTGFLFQFLVYAGLLFSFLRPRRQNLILVSFPLVLFLLTGTWKTRATRYLLPLAPFFCLIGAIGFSYLLAYLQRFFNKIKISGRLALEITTTAALLIILLPSVWKVSRFNYSLTQEDTRTTAKHWIEANIPAGTRLALESYCPQVSRQRYRVTYRHALYQADLEWLLRRRIEYIIVSDIMYARFTRYPQEFPSEARFYQTLDEKAILVKTFKPRWDEYLLDLHNPTIKIYRLSRLPDPGFPGNFGAFSERLRLQKIDENKWEIAASLLAFPLEPKEEAVKNIYLRGEDKNGQEIFLVPLYPAEIKTTEKVSCFLSQKIGPISPGLKLYIGYEIKFLRQPWLQEPAAFWPKEMKLAEITAADLTNPCLEFIFYYQSVSGDRGEDYFQKITFRRSSGPWLMKASIYGGELRWGNDSVLNPWIEIKDHESQNMQRIPLFSGLLGGAEAATKAPAEIETALSNVSSNFTVSIGYDYYTDLDLAEKAGGPRTINLEPPPELKK